MGGPKQKGVVTYCTLSSLLILQNQILITPRTHSRLPLPTTSTQGHIARLHLQRLLASDATGTVHAHSLRCWYVHSRNDIQGLGQELIAFSAPGGDRLRRIRLGIGEERVLQLEGGECATPCCGARADGFTSCRATTPWPWQRAVTRLCNARFVPRLSF